MTNQRKSSKFDWICRWSNSLTIFLLKISLSNQKNVLMNISKALEIRTERIQSVERLDSMDELFDFELFSNENSIVLSMMTTTGRRTKEVLIVETIMIDTGSFEFPDEKISSVETIE